MITFTVSPEKNAELRRRMEALGVGEEDTKERLVRVSGEGGQHVNRTSTCVQILHRPTGIEVKGMSARSQSLNRFLARRLLLARIAEARRLQTAKADATERVRRQEPRRARRAARKPEAPSLP